MQILFFSFIIFILPFSCAFAEEEVAGPSAPAVEEPEVIDIPERGSVNQEQAEYLALQEVPGEVSGYKGYKIDDDYIHEFIILKEDGTEMEVEVNASARRVSLVKIRRLGVDAKLPEPYVTEERALALAAEQVQKKTRLRMKQPKLLSVDYKLQDGAMVYVIRMEKVTNDYEVVINATSGEVLSVRKD